MVIAAPPNKELLTIFLQSLMRMLVLKPTDDVEIGRKMVLEKIEKDGISEERLQEMFDKIASEMAKSKQVVFSSIGSQQKFADGSFKDLDERFSEVVDSAKLFAESSK